MRPKEISRGQREAEPDDDVEEWMARRRREQDSLAVELAGLGPGEGLSEFQRLLAEAQVLEGYHGGDGLAGPLAEHVADLQAGGGDHLLHGEADLLPSLIVDRYGDYLVVQALSQGMDRLLPVVVGALKESCGTGSGL